MTDKYELSPALAEGLMRLAQGEFDQPMQRSFNRDEADTAAFFVNAIGEEFQRLISHAQEQESRLSTALEGLTAALVGVASGDFSARVERDYRGDEVDVLAYMVNNTVCELGEYVAEAGRKAEEDRRRLEEMVAERTEALKRLVDTDPLTKALNRRRLLEIAADEIARAERYGRQMCVAMLDLDHFKLVNDTFGHAIGDEVLKSVVSATQSRVRRHDTVGRYGGEEFLLVLPDTELEGAIIVAESVRKRIAAIEFIVDETTVPLSVSIGVADFRQGDALDDVLRRADDALYSAKLNGRNRIERARATSRKRRLSVVQRSD
ncbi:MAG: diguanylate cyclase [Myxococcales bacterium]|nr:diguanylate cyclase [Myxococcales bacterium]